MLNNRILIVEDEPFEAEHLRLELQQAGLQVDHVVSSGESCLSLLKTYQPDLLIVDILLGGSLDGIDTVAAINSTCRIPAIFLTAHTDQHLLERAAQTLPYAYLLKPYRPQELLFLVDSCLSRARVEQQQALVQYETQEKLRLALAVMENTREGVMVVDPQLKIVCVNPAFTRITGYCADDVIGHPPSILQEQTPTPNLFPEVRHALTHTGHWQGEYVNHRSNGEAYPEWMSISTIRDADSAITHYVCTFSDISRLKRSEADLLHLARHDALTDLPNRLMMAEHLQLTMRMADRSDASCAVLFMDLDRFKLINDSLGHHVGDHVLQEVAKRFSRLIREVDMIARLGGDEFVVILENIGRPIDASLVAEKLLQALEQPVIADNQPFSVTCSVGIAIYPKDGNSVDDLLRNADAAMYQAKEHGRNTYQFYTQELTEQALERINLYTALQRALLNDEFELHYQPLVSFSSGQICGMEALIRWIRPGSGMVRPDLFIAAAEETGLIVPIGDWVLRQACQQAAEWQAEGAESLRLAVNISSRQLRRGKLKDSVLNALYESGLEPEYLELELTESSFIDLDPAELQDLFRLREMGIQIAIDDFGTGLSSLSRLKKMPVSTLKIDRSFVMDIPDDPNDEAIARAIIALAKTLNLSVTAEGIETAYQHRFLETEGCNQGQGYLFSRPLPAADFARFYRSFRRAGVMSEY